MTRNTLRISNTDARHLFLERHGLSAAPSGPAHGTHLANVIHDLGFVQLDSINTVARAHDLILFSRRPRYRPKMLERAYKVDGAFFEHWTHDAAVIPMAFYPWWALRRRRDAELLKSRWSNWRRDGFLEQFQPVLDQIKDQGPVCAAQVGDGEKRGSGGWWDWHPSKTALEFLWRSGALAVVHRKGFQKYYDLTERVIEETLIDHIPDEEETIDWCCRNALARLGFATHGEIAAFWDHISPAEAKAWVERAAQAGEVIPAEVEAVDGSWRLVWVLAESDHAASGPPPSRLRILSPFDPALRDRARAERLFGFRYRIEIFVPEAKREYGYYVFPMLEGDRIVGRIDMKAFRADDVLRVKAVWPEQGVKFGKGRTEALEAELHRMLPLAGVSRFEFENGWKRAPKSS